MKTDLLSRRKFVFQNTALGIGTLLLPGSLLASPLKSKNGPPQFTDHGVASPIGQHRGIVATTDENGRDVVLLWLFDHRGGYALLMIDAETGKSEQFDMPFSPGDAPYSSILSSRNKFYTLFKGYFVEFDPQKRAFTFHHQTQGAAMSMTEDDNGLIWAASYPGSGLVSFDPSKKIFTDYGLVHQENWPQYQRSIAADNKGWIYFAVGYTLSQIVCFNPATKETRLVYEQEKRKKGSAYLYRDEDGKVYGKGLEADEGEWLALCEGRSSPAENHVPKPVKYISDSQSLFHKDFPGGRKIIDVDLTTNKLTTTASGQTREVSFSYTSDGAIVMGVALGPDGCISGGTAFPMRQFSFHPGTGKWENYEAYGQFNTVESDGKHLYVGGYPGGFLLRWDPSFPFKKTSKSGGNPAFLGEAKPDVYRPFRIFIHPDKDTVIYSGGPDYGYTGGGMVFWSKKRGKMGVVSDKDIVPDQSTMSLVSIGKGMLLGGSTTAPGTGGEKKAKEAVLFLLDERTRKTVWKDALIPGVQAYNDLFVLKDGKVAGVADAKLFFVFDPKKKELIRQTDLDSAGFGRTVLEQGPRIFVKGKGDDLYMIFRKGIARVDTKTHEIAMIAESPQTIRAGGAYLDNVIYFVCESHLWSCRLS